MFSIGCFDKEITERKIPLSFVFNDLRPIYIINKVAIFNEPKFGLVNYDLTLTL